MNIIVFGGAGFIGTNLIKRLVADASNHVLCVDDLECGKIENVWMFSRYPNYRFLKFDIVELVNGDDGLLIREIDGFLGGRVDRMYNLACPASPVKYQADPVHTLMTSIATAKICELALRFGCLLLHSSTSEVYGEPAISPQDEGYRGNVNTMGARSCYDEGKRVAETFLYEYYKKGCRCKVIRIFNTYGPYMSADDGRVVSNLICQTLRGEPVTIYGDGTQTRSFQYIDDLLDAMELVMTSGDDVIGPFNIGNPEEVTINGLLDRIRSVTGIDSPVTYRELPEDDPTHRRPDITKARTELGWFPRVALDDGLAMTVGYFRDKMEREKRGDTAIYIYTHKEFEPIVDSSSYTILTETSLSDKRLGVIDVNTGDNISRFGPCYSELKGYYWIWKNIKYEEMPAFVGFNHYRRYFTFGNDIPAIGQDEVILQPPVSFRIEGTDRYVSVAGQYGNMHNIDDLLLCETIIKEKYPEYARTFIDTMNGRDLYCNNLFVMSRDNFMAFMEWWFGVLSEFDRRRGFTCYDDVRRYVDANRASYDKGTSIIDYQYRIQAFLSERLLTAYMMHVFGGRIRHCDGIMTDHLDAYRIPGTEKK